jgi:hypothetical protein
MNVDELRKELVKRGANSADYRIQAPDDESTWCLRRQGKVWLVYYSERGGRRTMQRFSSESAACDYFLEHVAPARPSE